MTNILDCTFRDGGYYTEWCFSDAFVANYCDLINSLRIKAIEIGYINPSTGTFKGEFFHLHSSVYEKIRSKIYSHIEVGVMIDLKLVDDCEQVIRLLKRVSSNIDFVRFAVAPTDFSKFKVVAKGLSDRGIKICANLMYAHLYCQDESIFEKFLSNFASFDFAVVNIVDSFGCMDPDQVTALTKQFCLHYESVGFHGHDNLSLAAANALAAVNAGAIWVDSTFSGMGRGAGNLSTELAVSLFSFSSDTGGCIAKIEEMMRPLKDEFKWGSSVPYMYAAKMGLPQKNVMELMALKRLDGVEVCEYLSEDKLRFVPNSLGKNFINIEPGDFKVSLFVSASEKYIISTTQVEYLMRNFHLDQIYVCGLNAVEKNMHLISRFTSIISIIDTGSRLQKVEDKIGLCGCRLIALPPHSSLNRFENIGSTLSYSNPLEYILEKSVDFDGSLILLYGFDGASNFELRSETQTLLDKIGAIGLSINSLTPTEYTLKRCSMNFE